MNHQLEGFDFVSQQALNILASQAARNEGGAVILAGSCLLGREIQRCLKNCEVIWISADGYHTSDDRSCSPSEAENFVRFANDEHSNRGALILAGPLAEGDECQFSQSMVGLPVFRSLYVLAYGSLSHLRPEWRLLRASLSSVGWVGATIRRAGWVVDEEYGIYGLRSAAWGCLSKWWAYLGRQDLVDRCYYAMREGLVKRNGRASLAVWVVMGAKRSLR